MADHPGFLPWAVRITFLLHGATFSTFLSRIPSTTVRLELTDSAIGLVLTVFGTSAILAMQLIGPLVARWGGHRLMVWSLVALPVSLELTGLATSGVMLALAVVPFGALAGFLDVTMNSEGVAAENACGRPVLSSCHAFWSMGSLCAAVLAYFALRAELTERWHFGVNLVVVLAVAALAHGRLLRGAPAPSAPLEPATADAAPRRPGGTNRVRAVRSLRSGWSLMVVALGLMGFIALLTETAVGNWSGIYLHTERGEPLATASLGYVAFVTSETVARLVGDRWRKAVGAVAVVRLSGALAAVGLAAGVAGPWLPLSLVGFCLLGAGLANILPIVFGAVGHGGSDKGVAAVALSRLTALTYLGSLLGPSAIGAVAQVAGLRNTLAGLVPLLAVVVVTARLTAGADRTTQEAAAATRRA